MGWTYISADLSRSRKDIVSELFTFDEPPRHCSVVYAAERGSVIYLAIHRTNTATNIDEIFGAVVLTTVKKNELYNFGYKAIAETMGPHECRAPKKLLDMLSPIDDEYSAAWRKRCEENLVREHARRIDAEVLRNLPIGTYIRVNTPEPTIVHSVIHNGKRLYKIAGKWLRLTTSRILDCGFEVIAENKGENDT